MSDHEPRDLFCRGGCGFYGNPEWQWYCSKCWRAHQARAAAAASASPASAASAASQQQQQPSPRRRPAQQAQQPAAPEEPRPSSSKHGMKGFDQNLKLFLTRTTHQKDKRDKKHQHAKDKRSVKRPEPPIESKAVSSELAAFLRQRLDRQGVTDISRQLMALIDKITVESETAGGPDPENTSSIVQEFYAKFRKRMEGDQLFQVLTENERETILTMSEKYITICLYKILFCPPRSDDEEKDLALQSRIRRLNWISTKHLGCSINETSQKVRDLMHDSINDILGMDSQFAPQDKLSCLVKCCKKVFDMLQESNSSPASADDFLPVLIYILLKANPPRIQSNINYITRFCNEDKLRMGEAGYFFANLCCALSFVENLNADSINMNPEEFESYFTGAAVPPGSWQSSLLMCEGLQTLYTNLKELADLRHREEKLRLNAEKLSEEMKTFESSIRSEVELVLEKTKYEIRGPKKPVAVDDESLGPIPVQLPSPLAPTPVKGLSVPAHPGLEDFFGSSQTSSDNVSLLDLSIVSSLETATATASSGGGGAAFDAAATILQPTPLEGASSQSPPAAATILQPTPLEGASSQSPPAAATTLQPTPLEASSQSPRAASSPSPEPGKGVPEQAEVPATAAAPNSWEEYRGFSAQSLHIPSIACDNEAKDEA